ncbi:MAG: SpoIIE family protein phosphatase [Bacteroidales bacterium]|jgi:ligand-binding sensor domain-containing protein/serine phosphatase RsbU (regulator of sigma subunit)|nr:SpoIIE family protein phosphatase [Bacteroidales bacterium]
MLILLLLSHFCGAQTYRFRQYGIDKGLCHHTVYAITQDKNGFMWFATGMGLCRYDGFQFSSPENIPVSNVTTAFADMEGNLWFGYNSGLVLRYDGHRFSTADTLSNTTINQITRSPEGYILVASQNSGIVSIAPDGKTDRIAPKELEYQLIYSICCISKNRLLIGCDDGLYLCNYSVHPFQLEVLSKVAATDYETVRTIVPENESDRFWVVMENSGLFSLSVTDDVCTTAKIDVPVFDGARLQSVYEDKYKNLWVSTLDKGLFRLQISENAERTIITEKVDNYNSENGLGSNYVKQVFADRQGNLWVGTYGQGIACLPNRDISFIDRLTAIENNATAILPIDSSGYWIAGRGAIVKITAKTPPAVLNKNNNVPDDRITALFRDDQGTIWTGTAQSGLFRFNGNDARPVLSQYYHSSNSLSNSIQAIVSLNNFILYASRNGVIALNTLTGEAQVINTNNGLPHNNIRDIFKDSEGTVWIATNSNSVLSVNQWFETQAMEKKLETGLNNELEFSCLAEDGDGNIWAGTNGAGMFLFDRQGDITYQFTTQDGMKSDFCYAIAHDGKYIWVGHQLGLSRIDVSSRIITSFGTEYYITGDVNPNAMRMNDSELAVGFTNGVLLYHTGKEQNDEDHPLLNLTSVTAGDQVYALDEKLFLPYNQYRIRFDFIGLQYRNPENITYQYKLEGYDSEWTATNERFALYPRLEDGDYVFLVQACNGENCTEITELYRFRIYKPFWKTWWFILIAIGAMLGVIYTFFTFRERTHRKQQEYLERELAARTREVHEQKDEIEAKNRDITDSINYAQRIQFSVLPTTKTLLNNCTDAFIFYLPRDIVSGDFYWFDYFPEKDSLLIVCADSTGHGVPGAFMSLIGTTLIKDIVSRPDIQTPADILYRLDESVQSTLNQNQESEQSNDGMDIIVCEINIKSHLVHVSSAMRPFLVFHDGKLNLYKGSHATIGGQIANKKVFNVLELQLAQGDIIYMLTDGYPDQFGGPVGKKLKINRLQNILNDIHDRSMEEQCRALKEHFELWKGTAEQVDDVLMIGVKI